MTKRHDDVFDAVLSGLPENSSAKEEKGRAGARFLKRGNAISDRLSGENEEKTLHWIDPARCKMWDQHNRDYELLTADNCSDLIEGIRAQGKQEFPAIVRQTDDPDYDYEVICGARRHFAVSWLRANNYAQFKYLIEVRDLTDEEAFRLADIENRDREDISDFERAVDYARAVELYYGGKQRAMAERLEVSTVWLSRYLELARLPDAIVSAFPSIRDIKELHARALKPMLKGGEARTRMLVRAREICVVQDKARDGEGAFMEASAVVSALKSSTKTAGKKPAPKLEFEGPSGLSISVQRKGKNLVIEVPRIMTREDAQAALARFLEAEY